MISELFLKGIFAGHAAVLKGRAKQSRFENSSLLGFAHVPEPNCQCVINPKKRDKFEGLIAFGKEERPASYRLCYELKRGKFSDAHNERDFGITIQDARLLQSEVKLIVSATDDESYRGCAARRSVKAIVLKFNRHCIRNRIGGFDDAPVVEYQRFLICIGHCRHQQPRDHQNRSKHGHKTFDEGWVALSSFDLSRAFLATKISPPQSKDAAA